MKKRKLLSKQLLKSATSNNQVAIVEFAQLLSRQRLMDALQISNQD